MTLYKAQFVDDAHGGFEEVKVPDGSIGYRDKYGNFDESFKPTKREAVEYYARRFKARVEFHMKEATNMQKGLDNMNAWLRENP